MNEPTVASSAIRIGIVCHASFGGSGVIATELGLSLARRGHAVHFVCAGPPPRLTAQPNVTLHTVENPTHPLFPEGEYALALASTLATVCAEEKLQLIHVHYGIPHAASAYLARQLLGPKAPKLVTTLHGTDVIFFATQPAFGPVLRHSIDSTDALTVPSEYLAEMVRQNLGPRRVEVVPNFVDTQRFVPARERPWLPLLAHFPKLPSTGQRPKVLLHNSNFRPLKRVPDVVEVFARVNAEIPSVLVLIGDGPDREKVLHRVRELDLQDHVWAPGEVTEVGPILQAADLFLLPSEVESFGLAALEAFASGVPVIATRAGGLAELIDDGQTGSLHPVGDVAGMAKSALTLLRDEGLRSSWATRARAVAEGRFRPEPMVDRYLETYRRVLATPATH